MPLGNLPLAILVLDGWGINPRKDGNAVEAANPDAIRALQAKYPSTTLQASGRAVGLPEGVIGNSEVGHLCIGSGRIVRMELSRIHAAVAAGEFRTNPALVAAFEDAETRGSAVHLLGLVSDGGVHSHLDHLVELIRMAAARGTPRVRVHAFLDGRDTLPRSAAPFLERVESECRACPGARIATVSGRWWAMDRDRRWDRTGRAWRAIVDGEGETAPSAAEALRREYARGLSDEFVPPAPVARDGEPPGRIEDGDSVVCFNFRADRMRQLVRAFVEPRFDAFPRARRPSPSRLTTFTRYDAALDLPVAFPPDPPRRVLGEVLSALGLAQTRVAETEKYAHVTYFFNGGREDVFDEERRILVPSPKVASYDEAPGMSAEECAARAMAALDENPRQALVFNFANADMVGHTGNFPATVEACRIVDRLTGALVARVLERGGIAAVTADHGNAEQLVDYATGGPHTAHTTNPVPFVLAGDPFLGARLRSGGTLGDIAPTLLECIGGPVPEEMTGRSLLS